MHPTRHLRIALLLAACGSAPLVAQQRRYLVEVGAAGSFLDFDGKTDLKSAPGGVGRLGIWLHRNLSVEGEAGFYGAHPQLSDDSWHVRVLGASLLGNLPLGARNSLFLRAGYASTHYSSDRCPLTFLGPCGSSGGVIGGIGARVGITPTMMFRLEGIGSRGSGSITNLGASAGLSIMLGSKPLTDTDHDGVYDVDDRCPRTPAGALVDRRGCPTDTDADGVYDGLDRCPTTPRGAAVNDAGCPRDSDGDSVPDGIDACPNTPAGAAVNAKGCPEDSDGDGVPDGLDRCPATPQGASVDQLGCPGDEDGDRVLDGLDRCPRTPAGTVVNAFGCPPGVPPGTEGDDAFAPGARRVLDGIRFPAGSARLPDAARSMLDSLAAALIARPGVSVEIASYGDGTTRETLTLTQLRADAVRRYLITRGVPLQRVVAKGYGNSTPAMRQGANAADTNRRTELHVLPGAN